MLLAACLRKVGSRNPDPEIKALEDELVDVINSTGIGPLGMGGKPRSGFTYRILINSSCWYAGSYRCSMSCRSCWYLKLKADGNIEEAKWPGWFNY